MAEFCVCFWKSDHLRLVKMVLSIVFVFLSAEDFPIFLFSKINRSLSNIFKSMNRLLSLPTKIQIKNENTKNRSKDAEFSVKNVFFVENAPFGNIFWWKIAFPTRFLFKRFEFSIKNHFFCLKMDYFLAKRRMSRSF